MEGPDIRTKWFLGCFFSVLVLLTSIVIFRQFFILGPLILAWVAYTQWKGKKIPSEDKNE